MIKKRASEFDSEALKDFFMDRISRDASHVWDFPVALSYSLPYTCNAFVIVVVHWYSEDL